MDKRKIRDTLRLVNSVVFAIIYIPHIMVYILGGVRDK